MFPLSREMMERDRAFDDFKGQRLSVAPLWRPQAPVLVRFTIDNVRYRILLTIC
jgi:hypothetical protein